MPFTSDAIPPGSIGGSARAIEPAERLTPPARKQTVAATGDISPHSPLWTQAVSNAGGVGYDFAPMFADIAPVIGFADLAVCHRLRRPRGPSSASPIAPLGQALSTYPSYGVPVEVTHAIASVGYDRCSTAGNHTFDRGVAGLDRTVSALESVGVQQSGLARTLRKQFRRSSM